MNPCKNESFFHLETKTDIGRPLSYLDWSVFYEQRNADIIVMHNPTLLTAAVEVESSPRNVSRNLERNMACGCDAVAVVSLSERYLAQITNKVLDRVNAHPDEHIKVFLYNAQIFQELHSWLNGLAISVEKNRSKFDEND